MRLGDSHFAVFAVQMMLGKGQQIGMAVYVQVGWEGGLVHHSGMGVMVVHQRSRMMMMHQWSRVVGIMMQVSVGMSMLIDVCVGVVNDVMIDHRISIVQEVVWLIMHHLVHMMHWLHFMNGLMADNLGWGMYMSVMHMVVSVHIVIQMGRVAVMMVNGMRHCVQMVIGTIDHNSGAVAQVNAVRVMHLGVHKVRQFLVMMIVLQMRKQTRLSHAQQGQSADKELRKTSIVTRTWHTRVVCLGPTFITEISHLI